MIQVFGAHCSEYENYLHLRQKDQPAPHPPTHLSPLGGAAYTCGMSVLPRLFRPPLFQGSLSRSGYFEGWYFKQVSADLAQVWSFIPGVALSEERYAFIQIIDGSTGRTRFIRYPLEAFSAARDRFEVTIGDSRFSGDSLSLAIRESDLTIEGELEFQDRTPYPSRPWRPGIMGWYSFVPGMECRHGLVSMDHSLEGGIAVDGIQIDFSGGRGYVEKDWGRSFPESWIWIQCNSFEREGVGCMLSIAKIPWMGNSFVGFLGFLKLGEKTRFFATYNGAHITALSDRSRGDGVHEGVEVRIARGRERLTIRAESTMRGALKSPVAGRMESYIKESVDAAVEFDYRGLDGERLRGTGVRGGLEIVPAIFDEFAGRGSD